MMPGYPLIWTEFGCMIGNLRFRCDWQGAADHTATFPEFIIMKSSDVIETYVRVIDQSGVQIRSILELGIMRGGSVALFNALLKPQNHLAVDIVRRESGLSEYEEIVRAEGRRLRCHYDVSQDDDDTIRRSFLAMSGEEPAFDLIIDDASHDYEISLRSFNRLFPLLRPGGIYALEDWAWAHWGGPSQQPHSTGPMGFTMAALTNLVLHAAMSCAGKAAIAEVRVTPVTAFIIRGANVPSGFAVESSYLARGRRLHLL